MTIQIFESSAETASRGGFRAGTVTTILRLTGLCMLLSLTARSQDQGANSNLTLLSGTLAGQAVSASNRTITVAPTSIISGSFDVEINSAYPSFAVMAMGVTPTWGSPSSSFLGLASFATPVSALRRTVTISLSAPSMPGTYHIIAAFRAEFNAAQVMSCTSWSAGSPNWRTGYAVANWSPAVIETANANGTVLVNYLLPSGNVPQHMPATAITVVVSGSPAGGSSPQIRTVRFLGNSGAYTLTITGYGFGNPTVVLPYAGDVSNFRIGDKSRHAEWGYSGDAYGLRYESWSDTSITVSRFGGSPGDAIIIALWNAASGAGATWGGNVPSTASGPRINSVQLSGIGQNLHIVVTGTGFGSAPAPMPFTGDLNYFSFQDFRSHCGFGAGSQWWNHQAPDDVTLKYVSWSDTQIVVSGFSGAYGQDCATYQAGDPIAIAVLNTRATSLAGPQTAWGGSTGTAVDSVRPIAIGLSTDELVSILGQPKDIIDAGPKKIYLYDRLKVTFTNGKVSAWEVTQ